MKPRTWFIAGREGHIQLRAYVDPYQGAESIRPTAPRYVSPEERAKRNEEARRNLGAMAAQASQAAAFQQERYNNAWGIGQQHTVAGLQQNPLNGIGRLW